MTLGFFLFAAQHYAFLLLILAAACALGGRCLRRVSFPNAFERFVFATIFGLGGLGTITFLLGLAGLLHAPVVIFALLAMLATGWADLRDTACAARASLANARWWQLALGAALAAAGSPVLLLPLYPPVQWDSTSYHLTVAKMYASAHEVYFTPYLRSPVFPQLNELLLSLALLLYDDLAAQLIQLAFLLLTAALMVAAARRLRAPLSAGLWSTALWVSSPLVMMLGSSGYIEMSLACFLTAGTYAFVVWLDSPESDSRHWLLLAAAMLGFAEGTKYLALFSILIAGLVLLARAARARLSFKSPGKSPGASFADAFLFAAVLVIIAVPWHMRIGLLTNNPLWPYGAKYLGSGPWPIEHIQSMMRDQFNPGAGTGLRAALELPWNLTYHLEEYFTGELAFTPVILYLLPLTLLAAVWRREVRLLLALTALYTAFWFYTAQNARYLVHALPLLCLAAGLALGAAAGALRRVRLPAPVLAMLSAAITVAIAAPGYHLARLPSRAGWVAIPEAPPPITEEARAAYIMTHIPEYDGIRWLNQTHPGPYTLYCFPGSNFAYFVNGTFVGDWYGPARYDDYLAQINKPEGMYQFLRKHHVDYLLVNQASNPGQLDWAASGEFLKGHLRMIYARNAVIFKVEDQPVRLAESPELLTNPTLDPPPAQPSTQPGAQSTAASTPHGWTARGTPQIDPTGKLSENNSTTVGATYENWLEQTIPVEPGGLYLYRAIARTSSDKQYGVMHVEWLDAAGNTLGNFRRHFSGKPQWADRATAVAAPPGAVQARIHATTTDTNVVWYDNFSFRQIRYE